MKKKIIETGKILGEKGFEPGISGNISVRVQDGFLISASGAKLSRLAEEDIVKVDFDGNLLEGNKKPSSEKNLHAGIYKLRPDICAIIHCHCPKSTALSACHIAMDKKLLADCVFYFKEIPLALYAMPSSSQLVSNTVPLFENHTAVLMANHGLIVGAKDLDEAFYLTETAEFNAGVYIDALSLKMAKSLDSKAVKEIENLSK